MAHFAKLDENNVVIEINVVNNSDINDLPFPESEPVGIAFLTAWAGQEFTWKQTSYNGNFRKNYAGIGMKYDAEKDAFIPQHPPWPSWILNEDTCTYEAPVPYPPTGDGYIIKIPDGYIWDEETLSWKVIFWQANKTE